MTSQSKKSTHHDNTRNDTRSQLLCAAKTLFARKGYDGTTVKDVSKAAKVNISLISYHFQGKEGLYRACLEQFGKARLTIAQRVLLPPTSCEEFKVRLTLFIEELFLGYIEEPELCQVITRESEMQIKIAKDIFRDTFLKIYETLTHFIEHARLSGFLRNDLNSKIISGIILNGTTSVFQKDKINEVFFGNTIRDAKYRESFINNAISFWLHGCITSPL